MQSSTGIDVWDLTEPTIPTRSRLFDMEPIGVGTAETESLTSYISRLALAHSVTPRTLVVGEVFPYLGRHSSLDYGSSRTTWAFYRESPALNSMKTLAECFVDTLGALTSRPDLRWLTMLTWAPVLSTRRLVRPIRAWCPCCLHDARRDEQPIYERLLWALADVEVCPHHQVSLQSLCPHLQCRRPNFLLAQRSIPGYCSCCGQWLGQARDKVEQHSPALLNLDWHMWVANVVGELIQTAPTLLLPPSNQLLTASIVESIELEADGDIERWVRKLNLPVTGAAVWAWTRAGSTLTLEHLLRVCRGTNRSPIEIITGSIISTTDANVTNLTGALVPPVSSAECIRRGGAQSKQDPDFNRILVEDPPPSLREICRRFDRTYIDLRRHFPAQTQIVVDRCRASKHDRASKRKAALWSQVQHAVMHLHERSIYPSTNKIEAYLQQPGCFRSPVARAARERALAELETESLPEVQKPQERTSK